MSKRSRDSSDSTFSVDNLLLSVYTNEDSVCNEEVNGRWGEIE